VYGDCPQIMMEGVVEDIPTMQQILASSEWAALHEQLLDYVDNYRQKLVRANTGFQI